MEFDRLENTVDDLAVALAAHKAEQECRLTEFEKKQQERKSMDESVTALQSSLTQTQQRISRLEASQHRPLFGEGALLSGDKLEAKQSFLNYVRKGAHAQGLEVKELSTDRADGLIPEYVSDKIVGHLNAVSPMRSLASMMEVSGDGVDVLIEKTAADAGWVAEKENRLETSTPEIAKLHIPTREMYARPKITQKLLDDARIDLEEWIVQKITDKMVSMENSAFLKGDGEKCPRGILSYPYGETPKEWGEFQSISLSKDNFGKGNAFAHAVVDLLCLLKPQYLQGAAWIMSRQMLAHVRKLKEEVTGRFLWEPSLAAGAPSMLLGYPVILMDDMPALQSDGGVAAIFGNFKAAYQIVDRSGFTILRDPYSSKPYVEFYVTRRVGGDVINFDALKVLSVG